MLLHKIRIPFILTMFKLKMNPFHCFNFKISVTWNQLPNSPKVGRALVERSFTRVGPGMLTVMNYHVLLKL